MFLVLYVQMEREIDTERERGERLEDMASERKAGGDWSCKDF